MGEARVRRVVHETIDPSEVRVPPEVCKRLGLVGGMRVEEDGTYVITHIATPPAVEDDGLLPSNDDDPRHPLPPFKATDVARDTEVSSFLHALVKAHDELGDALRRLHAALIDQTPTSPHPRNTPPTGS